MTTYEFIIKVLLKFLNGFASFFLNGIYGLKSAFDFTDYIEYVKNYTSSSGGFAWVIVVVEFLLLLAIIGVIIWLIVLLIKKIVTINKSLSKHEVLINEVSRLNKELVYTHNFLDKKLKEELSKKKDEDDEDNDEVDIENGRFSKLLQVDKKYIDGNPEILNDSYTLKEVCENFRNFSASRLKLFYDIQLIREFVASLSSVRLIILQGISGTGKTSLPYAFGKFLNNDSFIQAVQPSWRERSEMLGFFNEFTKKYKEPEFLRNLYEAHYSNNVHITVLDEMNIARVEYYFAEFLSVLEMPRREEWIVELVATTQKDDPKLMFDGKITLPPNMWFVGTANNDDSTFAISDKVYDRALIIDIDKKFEAFEPVDADPMPLDYRHLYDLFDESIKRHKIAQENLDKINELDLYVIEHFRIAFGNRIMKQVKNFVPAFIDCGGTELEAIDYLLVKKVFRKFQALNLSYIREEVESLITKLDSLWGNKNFKQSKEFLNRILKM